MDVVCRQRPPGAFDLSRRHGCAGLRASPDLAPGRGPPPGARPRRHRRRLRVLRRDHADGRRRRGPCRRRRLRGRGCGAATAAASAAVDAGPRARACSTPPASARARSPTELGGLSPAKLHAAELAADALARALGAAVRADAAARRRSAAAGDAGGDERRRRQRRRGAACARTTGRDGGGDARAVGRRRERRRAQLLLGHRGRPGPRRWPTGWVSRTSRSTCAPSSAPASSTRSSPGTPRVRRPTRASAATATCASTRCSSWPTASAARTPRHRPLRAHGRDRRRARAAAARRRRQRQGPDLHARRRSRPSRWPGCGSRSASCASPRCATHRGRGRAARRRQGSTPRTSASWPAPAGRGSWRATAASQGRPGRDRRRAPARCSAAHPGQHRFTVGQRRGVGIAVDGAAVRARTRMRATDGVTVGPREALRTERVAVRGGAAAPQRRPRRRRQAALPPAPAARRVWPAARPRAGTARLALELDDPSTEPRPASSPA